MKRVTSALGALALTLLSGACSSRCGASAESRASSPASSSSVARASSALPVASAVAPEDVGAPIDPAALGVAGLAPASRADGNRLVHDGLAKHAKGDYAGSLAAFEAAVEAGGDTALARFDLACAASRLGDLERAERTIEALLREDLPSFRPRFEADDDLASLRASPAGARLRALAGAIDRAYRDAASAGVSAVLFQAPKPALDSTVIDPSTARPGVWLHGARRFFPLAPRGKATSAWFDRARRRSIVLTIGVTDCGSDFCPRVSGGEVALFDMLAAEPSRIGKRTPFEGEMLWDATVVVRDDIFLDANVTPARDVLRLEPGGLKRATLPKDDDGDVATLEVDATGTLLGGHPAGFRVERGELVTRGGARVKLGADHTGGVQTIVADDTWAAIATSVVGCICDRAEQTIHRHAVSTIDLATGKVTSLDRGATAAATALDGAGALYVQAGARVRRFASIRAARAGEGEELPAGVVLAVPKNASSHCCGL